MKPLCCGAGLILTGVLALTPISGRAELQVTVGVSMRAQADFYEPLTPYGGWVEVGSYGRCWHPARVAAAWRPYCDGHWEWSDLGWYWVSDEPWGWACYHYGSWVDQPGVGWIWVPGLEWAPAWVSWRVGGGYIGWAPLPPRRVGIVIAPAPFFFVEERRIHERVTPTTVIVNNTTIINKTTVINNSVRQETRSIAGGPPRQVMINEGPNVKEIQDRTGKPIPQVPVQQLAMKSPAPPAVQRQMQERNVAPGTAAKPTKSSSEPSQPVPSAKAVVPITPDHAVIREAPGAPDRHEVHPAPNVPGNSPTQPGSRVKRKPQGHAPGQPGQAQPANPGQERKHEKE